MSIFTDKKFEAMDWISQATEPYEVQANQVLAILPDESPIELADICRSYWGSPSARLELQSERVLSRIFRETKINDYDLRYNDRELIANCFKFQVEGTDGVIIDFDNNTITGVIKYVKVNYNIPEKEAKESIDRCFASSLNRIQANGQVSTFLLDVAELFLTKDSESYKFIAAKSGRLNQTKIGQFSYAICAHINEKDRLRSEVAAIAFGELIAKYVMLGDPKLLGEIFRIKTMMDNGQAIYTIKDMK